VRVSHELFKYVVIARNCSGEWETDLSLIRANNFIDPSLDYSKKLYSILGKNEKEKAS
jgi:hypothetical protein